MSIKATDFRADHLLFLHIHKTAGSTFHNIIERQYDRKRTQNIYHMVNGLEAFHQLPVAQRNSLQLVKGHFPYGIHSVMNGTSEYITVLREPIERTLSHFHHISSDPNHVHHKKISALNFSLSKVLENGVVMNLDNNMVRMLSGENRTPYGEVTNEMLEKADDHLEKHFAIVGLQSRFDEFLLMCAHRYGWKRFLWYRKANVRKSRPAVSGLDAQTLETVQRYNTFDLQLYAKWKPIAEQRIADEQTWLQDSLKTFKAKNARLNKWLGWWPKVLTP